ncbi:MAG: hypothetical protein ACE5FD_05850 [Anaerolineae bacterium]
MMAISQIPCQTKPSSVRMKRPSFVIHIHRQQHVPLRQISPQMADVENAVSPR